MKTISAILVTAALLLAHSAFGQEMKGFEFRNGLPVNIVDGYVARAEKCEIFICGKWLAVAQHLDIPLEPGEVALVAQIVSSTPGKEVVCLWDIRAIAEPVGGGEQKEHIFKGLNFCTPEISSINFIQDRFNTYAVHTFKDAQGQDQRILVPSSVMQ